MEIMMPEELYDLKGCYIEITSRCNLRCLHCYNESGNLDGEISFQVFKKIVDEFIDEKTDITISGGEPLLHPQIREFVEYLGNKNFKNSLLITNATLIDCRVAEMLTENKMPVQVSINGINAEEHDALCGKGNFDKTMRGLDNLINSNHPRIVIRCMVSAQNHKHIEEFIVKMSEKAHVVVIGFLSEMGRGKKNKEIIGLNSFEKHKLINQLKESKEINKLKKEGKRISIPEECFNGGCPLIHPASSKLPFSPRINSKGEVFLCQAFDDENYAVGNINSISLHEIVKSDKLCHFINFLNMGIQYMPKCRKCVWKMECGRGCIAQALDRGSVQETDGNCDIRKSIYGQNLINSMLNAKS